MSGHRITPDAPCTLCGGTYGSGYDGAHALCRARAERGAATPCLGMRCPCCRGAGCHPVSVAGPVNPSQDTVERWAPACRCCEGSGVVHVSDGAGRKERDAVAARKRYWSTSCGGMVRP